MSSKKPRPGVRGNDLFREISLPGTTEPFSVTYWDLWFVVILLNQFEGEWERLIYHFRAGTMEPYGRDIDEPLLSHLKHLYQRVTEAGLTAEALLGEEGEELLDIERKRAQRKLSKAPSQRQMSYWMKHRPRIERQKRAMSGYWDRFKPSPKPHARALKRLFKKKYDHWYRKDETYDLSLDLLAFLEERLSKASDGRTVAVYRAFLTIVVDRMGRIQDSYGTIGHLCSDVFEYYITLPRTELKMSLSDFFQDLMEWLIWEDQGVTHEYLPDFFASLAPDEVQLVAQILNQQCTELLQADLYYQFDDSLTMLALLRTQHQKFEHFVKLAGVMGTRYWQRITRMAEMAESHQRIDIALAVYEAALKLGELNHRGHQKFLGEKYEELKARVAQSSSD